MICNDSPTGKHVTNVARFGDTICIWCLEETEPAPVVWNRDGTQRGVRTGATRVCSMEGCTGERIVVRWPDGKITYPCSKGMFERRDGAMQIG